MRSILNSFIALFVRFLALLILYTFLRIGFYWMNSSLFPGVTFQELQLMLLGGIKFDICALLYLNSPFILLQILPFSFKYNPIYERISKIIFLLVNSIGIALNFVDYAYYPFTLKRTTGTVLDQFSNESNLLKLTVDFLIDYWYLSVLLIACVYLLRWIYNSVQVLRPASFGWKGVGLQSAGLLFTVFLFIGGVRGGWAHSTRPITLSNAGDYVESPEEMSIVLNTPFSILKTLGAVNLKPLATYDEKTLAALYDPIHRPQAGATFKPLNVVFLILESFGKEHIGALNTTLEGGKYRGFTPFLDSLIQQSYTFSGTFANGRKSIDALPAVITGIPSVGEPFVLSVYAGNETTSIAKLLAAKGYETAFFHGAPNGSMGFSAYTKLAGIAQYYGKNEYNNDADFDGIWGIWDEPFMQFMAQKMNGFKEPFFSSFFSLSSHHPFKVPAEYQGVFPKGALPVQEPIGYTDHALRKFFATAAKMPWYKNTLFVICADHATTADLPAYKTVANGYAIPIIFYHPGGDLVGKADKLVQQIDILPTVLNYLHYDKPYLSFGFDAFQPGRDNFLVNNNAGTFNIYYKDYFMTHSGEKARTLHNLRTDGLMKQDLLGGKPAILDTMETKLKAFMQQYNNRMIKNQLTVDE